MSSGVSWIIGCVLSCAEVAPTSSSAASYRDALTTADSYEASVVLCRQVQVPSAEAECLLSAMLRWGRLTDTGCDAIDSAVWRDECRFMLAERLLAENRVNAAVEMCDTTRFRRSCLWHLLRSEAQASAEEGWEQAEARVSPFDGAQAVPDAYEQFWMLRFRSQMANGEAVDERDCQMLSRADRCERAVDLWVRSMLDEVGRGDASSLCVKPEGERVLNTSRQAAWRLGPVALSAERRWEDERCGGVRPPPPLRRHGDPAHNRLGQPDAH